MNVEGDNDVALPEAPDSEEAIRELAGRVFEEMWNGKNLTLVEDLYSPHVVFHTPSQPRPLHGPTEVRGHFERILTGFPDFYTHIDEQVVQGDMSAVRFSFSGTHLGPYMGLPPTGRHIESTQIVMVRVVGGQIAEVWQEVNALRQLAQLGVLPPTGAGPLALLGWTLKTIGRFAYLEARRKRAQRL